MTKVVGARFGNMGKVYYFDPNGLDIKKDQYVVVETVKGIECGKASFSVKEINDDDISSKLKPVIRIANEDDIRILEENKEKEKRAFKICTQKIAVHGLDMSLAKAEYSFDRSKITFYFTADGRVDFRELVSDLGSTLHMRVDLRQIGVRDESKMIGGFGMCGRPFCCSTFLNDFHSVSIKMAKDQNLSLATGKLSGTCGRLMCCLKYEQNSYEYLHKITPNKGAVVDCAEGRGTVVDSALLTGKLKVRLDSAPDAMPATVDREDVRVIRDGKQFASKK
ncbi:MAG: stage 0 sporulation family protein [Clostridiales bacterium]|nr:stage 0 sporulation family protein [Clostridiales bacterium]